MYKKYLYQFLTWLSPSFNKPPELEEAVNQARINWQQSLYDYNYNADVHFIDYFVYNIKAREQCYMALLRQAQQEGVTAWPSYLCYTGVRATDN